MPAAGNVSWSPASRARCPPRRNDCDHIKAGGGRRCDQKTEVRPRGRQGWWVCRGPEDGWGVARFLGIQGGCALTRVSAHAICCGADETRLRTPDLVEFRLTQVCKLTGDSYLERWFRSP